MAMSVSAQRLFKSASALLLPSKQTMKDKMDGLSLKKRTRVILFGGVFIGENILKNMTKITATTMRTLIKMISVTLSVIRMTNDGDSVIDMNDNDGGDNFSDMNDNDIGDNVFNMNDNNENLRTFWAPAAAR